MEKCKKSPLGYVFYVIQNVKDVMAGINLSLWVALISLTVEELLSDEGEKEQRGEAEE